MTLLVLGLLVFLGTHSVSLFAPAARDRWAAALGEAAWRGLYSLLSLAGFAMLVYGYGLARQAPVVLYVPPGWLRPAAWVLMLPVFPLLFAAQLPGRIQRAVKHPMITAVKAWALAHLLANGMLADALLFGSFLAWAVADRISLKRRVPRPLRTAPPSRWNDLVAVAGGLVVYAVVVAWLHRLLIGVSPL